jgi:hypothetical protein
MAGDVLGAAGGLKVDTVFLDTTYCQPRYTFPPQVSEGWCASQHARRGSAIAGHGMLLAGQQSAQLCAKKVDPG